MRQLFVLVSRATVALSGHFNSYLPFSRDYVTYECLTPFGIVYPPSNVSVS